MAFLQVKNTKIVGISACVPKWKEDNISSAVFDSEEEAKKFISSTGVASKRMATDETTTADICYEAANTLLEDLKWKREEVECLIFVTQTPDYILPATSCILQDRLGLSKECYTLDISLGCSGWVYGLSVIKNLLSTGNMKKGLLLAGDTTLKINSKKDKSAWPLFGDAGTATAIEFDTTANDTYFHLSTDGSGSKAIIIPDGGYRHPVSADSFVVDEVEKGICRNRLHTILNGMDVFTFGISQAPKSVNKLLEKYTLDKDEVDIFTFHQANLFMNEKIRKKLKLPIEKVPYSLKEYGNTSSATIPLTLVTQERERLQKNQLKQVACGFGVGLSWGSVYFETKNIVVSKLIEI